MNFQILLYCCLIALSAPVRAEKPVITLTPGVVIDLAAGTHRPEIFFLPDGDVLIAVVEPRGQRGTGQVKHRAYVYEPDLSACKNDFILTRTTDEHGEPADHRAVIADTELVIVYQTLISRESIPGRHTNGPAEQNAREQSLLLARFSFNGDELFRAPVVEHVTDFTRDNFPDHCLCRLGDELLVSTGTKDRIVNIRRVGLDAAVHAAVPFNASRQSVPETIGNSLFASERGIFMVSGSGPVPGFEPFLSLTELDTGLLPGRTVQLKGSDREMHFPTGVTGYRDIMFIAYISRSRGGGMDMMRNPYEAWLMAIDQAGAILLDTCVGIGGFSHVHPTVAVRGNRLLYAWSRKAAAADRAGLSSMPRVQIREFFIE